MAYRKLEPVPREPRRTMQDTATPMKVYVQNGATANFAVPCWYREAHIPIRAIPHDGIMHDHRGWPNPRHKDGSCQWWDFSSCRCCAGHACHIAPGSAGCGMHRTCKDYIDMRKVFPIHLKTEGYSKVKVDLLDAPAGVTATAWIDEDFDWIVRVMFDVATKAAITESAEVRFSVRVERTDGQRTYRDIVTIGTLKVLPAVLSA